MTIQQLITILKSATIEEINMFRIKIGEEPVPVVCSDEVNEPEPSDYRIAPEEIDYSLCLGRIFDGSHDTRWSPAVYYESQCSRKPMEGHTLCPICYKRLQSVINGTTRFDWGGCVNEELPDSIHMLGSEWSKKCKFNPSKGKIVIKGAKRTKEMSLYSGSHSSGSIRNDPIKVTAVKPKTSTPSVKVTGGVAIIPSTPKALKCSMEIKLIDGIWYFIKETNVFSYDYESQTVGDYVGQLNYDYTIDNTVSEITESE